MDVFVARQPIFNIDKEIFAYELLFRTGMSNAFPDVDGDTATTSLLSSSFFTVGIDKISGGKISFINFTEELLLKKYPEMFPPEKIMIEVLEDVEPTPQIIDVCNELKENGYKIALDDFVYEDKFAPLVKIANIIKIDFLLTPIEEIEQMVKDLNKYSCVLLAEKIETYEEFEKAVTMGFELFQGYFFSKPEILKNRDISSNKMTVLQLVSEVNRKEFNVDNIRNLINQDVSISYKLLNYLNSAYFSRIQPIASIKQAIAFLGARGVQQFVSLVAVGQLASGKPEELIRTSIIRARFLEKVGGDVGKDSGELFMLGLFSLIDAMLDNSMKTLIEKLPLSSAIREALGQRCGELYPYLQLVECYESGSWDEFDTLMNKIGLGSEKVVDMYLDSVGWADSYSK